MSSAPAKLFVAIENGIVYLRVVGRATFVSGADFKRVVESLIDGGHERFAVDLKECVLMDSTFIGLLTGFGMQFPPSGKKGFSLHNASERVAGLLSGLGVIHLFIPCPAGNQLPEDLPVQPAEAGETSHLQMQRMCLEAHQKLMEVNPENIHRFKDVTNFLAEDLKKSEGQAE